MTGQHPILPTQKQFAEWDSQHFDEGENFDLMMIKAFQAGADWQLEQVIEFLESESCSDYGGTLHYPTKGEDESIRETLLRAMRPQVVDLPQANSDVCGEEGMRRARQQTFEENDELLRKLADS